MTSLDKASHKPIPGVPVALTAEQTTPGIIDRLYTLSYIKHNAVKTKLLLLPSETGINEAVELSKEYCRSRGYSFSWLEKSIEVLERKTI